MFSSARILGVAALVAAFAAPAAVFAQQAPAVPMASPGPGMHRHHHGNGYMRALRSLNLSDAQKQQIKSAVQQTRQANQNADPATHKANAAKLRSQIDGILTADQRAQLQATMQQQRQMRERTQGAGPVPAPTSRP